MRVELVHGEILPMLRASIDTRASVSSTSRSCTLTAKKMQIEIARTTGALRCPRSIDFEKFNAVAADLDVG